MENEKSQKKYTGRKTTRIDCFQAKRERPMVYKPKVEQLYKKGIGKLAVQLPRYAPLGGCVWRGGFYSQWRSKTESWKTVWAGKRTQALGIKKRSHLGVENLEKLKKNYNQRKELDKGGGGAFQG